MIIDNISSCKKYYGVHPLMKKAFEAIKKLEDECADVGKYDIVGDSLFCKVQEYNSKLKSEGKFENHIKYIDIQYIVSGQEDVYASDGANLERTVAYSTEKDVEFTTPPENSSYTTLNAGDYIILFPGEVHCPGLAVGDKIAPVKKILVKIEADF